MAKQYDLEERTAVFGETIIRFAKQVPRNAVNRPLISQLARAATSVGANYTEADEASSRKEFRYRITLCRKESKETLYWLRMIAAAEPKTAEDARGLWREAKELHLIFSSIARTTEQNDRSNGNSPAIPAN